MDATDADKTLVNFIRLYCKVMSLATGVLFWLFAATIYVVGTTPTQLTVELIRVAVFLAFIHAASMLGWTTIRSGVLSRQLR